MIDKILYTFLIAGYCLGMPCALIWSVRSGNRKVCPGVSAEHSAAVCPGVFENDPLYTSWLKSVEFQYRIR